MRGQLNIYTEAVGQVAQLLHQGRVRTGNGFGAVSYTHLDVYKRQVTDLSYAVTSAFYCGKLVLACSTYDGGLFPPMKEFLDHLQTKGFRNRRIGLIENGSWAPAAARLMRAELEKMKELRLCETEVSLRGALNQTSEVQMDALVAELCAE